MNDDLYWVKITDHGIAVDHTGMTEGAKFAIYGDIAIADHQWRTFGGEWKHLVGIDFEITAPLQGPSPIVTSGNQAYRIQRGRGRLLKTFIQGEQSAVDPAGRIWSLACGSLLIARDEPIDLAGKYGCGSDI